MTESPAMDLKRLLRPRTIAIVGASENQRMSNSIVQNLLTAGKTPVLINPRHPVLYGMKTIPGLDAMDAPADAVVSLVGAERTIEIVAQAGAMGCGGVVALAGGFAEAGEPGRELQRRLEMAAASGGVPVIGPNCAGFANLHEGVRLFSGAPLPVQPGGLAVVSQSGYFVRSAWAAGLERRLGFSYGISSGNEAVCGLADYLRFLIEDERTRAVLLVLEKIRDPGAFFAAAHAAQHAGKPIIALKLGQSSRGRAIAQSHTGALASDSWTYDAALRQAGVLVAQDVDDLLDQAQLFELTPRARWKPLPRLGVVSTSGGVAALAADMGEREGVELPIPAPLQQWVGENLPTSGPANPLDVTGFAVSQADTLTKLFERYSQEPEFDALLLAWWCGPHEEEWARALTDPFCAVARHDPATLMLLAGAHAGTLGDWAVELRAQGVLVGRSVRSMLRACGAMTGYFAMPRRHVAQGLHDTPALPQPAAIPISTPEGSMLPFGATMDLLSAAGVPVAPYLLLHDSGGQEQQLAALGPLLVLKLANIPHRTEYGAVRMRVPPAQAGGVVGELRAIAHKHGFDPTVVAQPMMEGSGEAFVGVHGASDFGPLLLFGLGGIYVELVKRVSGRVLPLSGADAGELVDEVGGSSVLAGFRGQAPWSREALTRLLEAVSLLGAQSRGWLESLDLNPVICGPEGCWIVDATCLVKST